MEFTTGTARLRQSPLVASADTVVTTWTLCSISNVRPALAEMRRVLKPGGRLLFVEHGRAPEPNVRWWQDQLTPVWKRLSGGCHLNRAINALIEGAGFQLERVETSYMHGPKAMIYRNAHAYAFNEYEDILNGGNHVGFLLWFSQG